MKLFNRKIDTSKLKEKIRDIPNKLRKFLKTTFLAESDTNNNQAKKKQRKLLKIIIVVGIALIFFMIQESEKKQQEAPQNKVAPAGFNLNLSGVKPADKWARDAQRKMEEMRQEQSESNKKLTLASEELAKQRQIHEEQKLRFLEELQAVRQEMAQLRQMKSNNVEVAKEELKKTMHVYNKPERKIKKISEYIPAGSYVPAKMISGVDVSVGITSGADPRQVLLRVVGEVVSTGFGDKYLRNDKLIGCVIQAQATGDLSSEKAYLKPVIMTCAKDEENVLEIPVKGYITSSGKVGIRGEIVSREVDFVTKSFLAGMVSGIGRGLSDLSQPDTSITSSGFALNAKKTAKELASAGIGEGISNSSGMLSDYFIRRAEQYQPVISINEGTDVTIVFQEGFKIEDIDNAKRNK